jgi:hypothetical protein
MNRAVIDGQKLDDRRQRYTPTPYCRGNTPSRICRHLLHTSRVSRRAPSDRHPASCLSLSQCRRGLPNALPRSAAATGRPARHSSIYQASTPKNSAGRSPLVRDTVRLAALGACRPTHRKMRMRDSRVKSLCPQICRSRENSNSTPTAKRGIVSGGSVLGMLGLAVRQIGGHTQHSVACAGPARLIRNRSRVPGTCGSVVLVHRMNGHR